MKLKIIIILFCLLKVINIVAQNYVNKFREIDSLNIDSFMYSSDRISVLYTLQRIYNLKNEFLFKEDLVFKDSLNNISKINIINNGRINKINCIASTIPIDDIIIDDSRKLIICLSLAEVSPYNILIYDFDCNVLFKKSILPLEVVLDSKELDIFKKLFPKYYNYVVKNNQIIKIKNTYYIDLIYWRYLSEYQKGEIKEFGWLKTSHYFPYLFPEQIDGISPYKLSKYQNFYSKTDPFYDFDIVRNLIIGIILNNENGDKIKIPFSQPIKIGNEPKVRQCKRNVR